MKVIFRFSLLTFLMLFVSHAHGQKITKAYYRYFHNERVYEFQDMDDIFIANPDSYIVYKSALKARKNTRLFGHITIGVMAVGTLAMTIDNRAGPCEFICVSPGDVIGILGWLFIVPVTALVGLITRINYNSRKKKAVNLFNAAGGIGQLYIPASWNTSFGSAPHGVGLTINF